MNILITGAGGFLAQRMIHIWEEEKNMSLSGSTTNADIAMKSDFFHMKSINRYTDWSDALSEQEIVIHCAGVVHKIEAKAQQKATDYYDVNYEGSVNLARQAVKAGVRRFIYISSIKVNGENSEIDKPFAPDHLPRPEDHYAMSKLKAETELLRIGDESGMEVVIIRPPMIYGIKAKGNFSRLVSLTKSSYILPFKKVRNRRSLVYVDNLIDLISKCCWHPNAVGQVLLVSDNEDVSLPELIEAIAKAYGANNLMIPVPLIILKFILLMIGKRDIIQKVLMPLQVDITKTCTILDWQPPFSVLDGLRRCANGI